MRVLFCLVFCYLIAAPLTDRISLDLRLTHWWDIATYLFLIFGAVIWAAIIFLGSFLVYAVLELRR